MADNYFITGHSEKALQLYKTSLDLSQKLKILKKKQRFSEKLVSFIEWVIIFLMPKNALKPL
jgi:hypothetical protein